MAFTLTQEELFYTYPIKKRLNVQISLSQKGIIDAVKRMKKKDRESFLEDFLAATSPEYLTSIREARADYKTDRTMTHKEVFSE
jgi:hypothetical protein